MAKIAIDAGHGLKTLGKRCMKSLDANETREWVLNDRVADSVIQYLQSAGHRTKRVDDPSGGKDISLAQRVKAANAWNADFYLSVHHNAGVKGGKGGGTVVYVYTKCSSASLTFQKAIYEHSIKRGNLKGNRSNGMNEANFYVNRNTKMPSCLIECGFMDSATDIKYILDPAWSDKIGLGIAEGICAVVGGVIGKEAVDKGQAEAASGAFKVKVLADSLNFRKGPGVDYEVMGAIVDKGVYTIVETAKARDGGTWGLLKAFRSKRNGWINISPLYVKKF